jgi:hypothetical protein
LLLGALHYLQKNSHQRVLLPEVEAKVLAVPTAGHEELLVRLFSVPAPQRLLPWLQALWRHQPLRNWAESRLPAERLRAFRQERIDARPRAVASSMPLTGSHESPPELTTLPVANAGLVLLWPLLPDLFARLGLWKNGAFTDMQAQINAACWLDAAIWAGDCAREWRMPLTKLLCGLPLESELEWQAPNEAAAAQLHQWLVALSAQLPGWRTLGTADIQTLFLQRPGRLERVDTAFTLAVQPEPFDILLSDWPWPLDALMLPWLERPLCIQWPSLSEQGRYQMSSGPVQ